MQRSVFLYLTKRPELRWRWCPACELRMWRFEGEKIHLSASRSWALRREWILHWVNFCEIQGTENDWWFSSQPECLEKSSDVKCSSMILTLFLDKILTDKMMFLSKNLWTVIILIKTKIDIRLNILFSEPNWVDKISANGLKKILFSLQIVFIFLTPFADILSFFNHNNFQKTGYLIS